MDESLRQLERARDPAELHALLRGYARAGRTQELLRAALPQLEEVAERLGELEACQDVYTETHEVPEAEECRVRLVAWTLPAELGGHGLLEVFRGRAKRRVVAVPRGCSLELQIAYRSGDAIPDGDTEITATVRTETARARFVTLTLPKEGPAVKFFEAFCARVGASFETVNDGWMFCD